MAINLHCFGLALSEEFIKQLHHADYIAHIYPLDENFSDWQTKTKTLKKSKDTALLLGFKGKFNPLLESTSLKEDPYFSDVPVILYLNTTITDFNDNMRERLADEYDQYDADLVLYQEHSNKDILAKLDELLKADPAAPFPQRINRERAIFEMNIFIAALKENIQCVENASNHPPAFDLALHEDDDFKQKIIDLIALLEELRVLLAQQNQDLPSDKRTLAQSALREFTLKLSGSIGTGLGNTITWGTRVSLGLSAIYILQHLGISPSDLSDKVTRHIPDITGIVDL